MCNLLPHFHWLEISRKTKIRRRDKMELRLRKLLKKSLSRKVSYYFLQVCFYFLMNRDPWDSYKWALASFQRFFWCCCCLFASVHGHHFRSEQLQQTRGLLLTSQRPETSNHHVSAAPALSDMIQTQCRDMHLTFFPKQKFHNTLQRLASRDADSSLLVKVSSRDGCGTFDPRWLHK